MQYVFSNDSFKMSVSSQSDDTYVRHRYLSLTFLFLKRIILRIRWECWQNEVDDKKTMKEKASNSNCSVAILSLSMDQGISKNMKISENKQ